MSRDFSTWENLNTRDPLYPKVYVTWPLFQGNRANPSVWPFLKFNDQWNTNVAILKVRPYSEANFRDWQLFRVQYMPGDRSYGLLAWLTALLMGRERNERRRSAGQPALLEDWQNPEWNNNFAQDYQIAYAYYLWNDAVNYNPVNRQFYAQPPGSTPDGIPVITPELQELRELSEQLFLVKQRDEAAIQILNTIGVDPRIVRDVSARTATDPVGRWVLEKVIREIIPGDAPRIDSGIAENQNLPWSSENRLSQEDEQDRLLFIGQTLTDPDFLAQQDLYGRIVARETASQEEARDYAYWLANAPRFEIEPGKNPDVPANVLFAPWNRRVNPQPSDIPPFIKVTVTPKGIPVPELGWLAENLGWLGPLISVVVPYVGWMVSLVFTSTVASQKKAEFRKAIALRPTSVFAPQYEPVIPFEIMMPLNLAQYVVMNPAHGPALAQQWNQLLISEDIERIREYLKTWSVPPASVEGIAARNLKPIGEHAKELLKTNPTGVSGAGDLAGHAPPPISLSGKENAAPNAGGAGDIWVDPVLTPVVTGSTSGGLRGKDPDQLLQSNLRGNVPDNSSQPAAIEKTSGDSMMAVLGLGALVYFLTRK